jgi:hypothetical protein
MFSHGFNPELSKRTCGGAWNTNVREALLAFALPQEGRFSFLEKRK